MYFVGLCFCSADRERAAEPVPKSRRQPSENTGRGLLAHRVFSDGCLRDFQRRGKRREEDFDDAGTLMHLDVLCFCFGFTLITKRREEETGLACRFTCQTMTFRLETVSAFIGIPHALLVFKRSCFHEN